MLEIIQKLLTAEFVGKMVRTGAQAATSGLVTHGILTGSEQEQAVGAIALIASVIWTAIAHIKATPVADPALGGLQ